MCSCIVNVDDKSCYGKMDELFNKGWQITGFIGGPLLNISNSYWGIDRNTYLIRRSPEENKALMRNRPYVVEMGKIEKRTIFIE